MWVDFHWHARDWQESAKETVEHSLAVAEAAGLDAIAAMPNTKPALTTLDLCRDYLALAHNNSVEFFVHIGLMPDEEQVKHAVHACRKEQRICGMKVYFGRSTGDLSITRVDDQFRVLETLAKEGYTGVLVGHCEDEQEIKEQLYNPDQPKTWSELCRPEHAEVSSVHSIISILEQVQFQGTFHIAHVSTPSVVDVLNTYSGSLKLSCGITLHHVLLDHTYLDSPSGMFYKCNPPLRKKETQQTLQRQLLEGKIPILESDHAPHLCSEKQSKTPPSGISSGASWPYVIEHFRKQGMAEEYIHAIAFENICTLYNIKVPCRKRNIDYEKLTTLQTTYPHDPFTHLK